MLKATDDSRCIVIARLVDTFVVTLVALNVHTNVCMRMLRRTSLRCIAETCLLAFGVSAAAAIAIAAPVAPYQLFIALPLLPWAAIRFGVHAACILMMALGASATWSVLNGITTISNGGVARKALLLVLSLNITAMLFLTLAALVTQRKEGTGAAQRDEARAREQYQVSHLGRAVLITQIFGTFVHELNQPLTSILANAEAAARQLRGASADTNELREILTDIIQEDRRATEVLRRLRALVLPKHAPKQSVDLNGVVKEVLQLLKSELGARRICVKTDLDPMLFPVLADRIQIQQVLLSLVINGWSSMSHDGPQRHELRLATRYLADARTIEISVAESGSGPPPGDIAWLFESGYGQHKEVGIGLIGARSIVEALGGHLWREVRTEGTIVRLTLPAS